MGAIGGSGRGVPVVCKETGARYPSVSEAARACNCHFQAIWRACNAPTRRAAGYHWQYEKEASQEIPDAHV
eukprot:g23371.t1